MVRGRWGWDGRRWEPRWGSMPSTQVTGEKGRPWSPQVPWRPMQSTVLLQRGERIPNKKGEHLRGYSWLESGGGEGPSCRSVPGPQGRAVGRSCIPCWLVSPPGRWLRGSGNSSQPSSLRIRRLLFSWWKCLWLSHEGCCRGKEWERMHSRRFSCDFISLHVACSPPLPRTGQVWGVRVSAQIWNFTRPHP